MFVLQSKYNHVLQRSVQLEVELLHTRTLYSNLVDNWNDLVERINKKGGEDFLNSNPPLSQSQFTKDEIRQLLQLCHPDKHDGKELAVNMTKRLLQIRG